MKKIYIYGTGSKAINYLPALSLNFTILGFIDSDKEKHSQKLLGFTVYDIKKLKLKVDESIIICSSYHNQINDLLLNEGFPKALTVDEIKNIAQLKDEYLDQIERYRHHREKTIPKLALDKKHLDNAKLIANRKELLELLPKNGYIAELGVANGDYSSEIIQISNPKKLHLIDVWHSERYNDELYNNVCNKFNLEINSKQIEIHKKLSYQAVEDFPDQYFDWVYIDTSHCYEGTKKELELYASKIKKGGYIAGHDYTMGNWVKQFRYGVMEAVHEFCVSNGWRIKYLTMDLSEGQSFAIEKL